MAGGISLHAVDVAQGVPATGMRIQVFRVDAGTATCIADARLGQGGELQHPIVHGERVAAGTHEAHFHLGAWWRERSGDSSPCFQEVAVFRFELHDVAQHYHLPMKFTRWGFALFRGA